MQNLINCDIVKYIHLGDLIMGSSLSLKNEKKHINALLPELERVYEDHRGSFYAHPDDIRIIFNRFLDYSDNLYSTINSNDNDISTSVIQYFKDLPQTLSVISKLYKDYANARYSKSDLVYVSSLNSILPRNIFNTVATSRIRNSLYSSLNTSISGMKNIGELDSLISLSKLNWNDFQSYLDKSLKKLVSSDETKKYLLDNVDLNFADSVPTRSELINYLGLNNSDNKDALSISTLLACNLFYINKITKILKSTRIGAHIFSSTNTNISRTSRTHIASSQIDIATTQDELLIHCSRLFKIFENSFKKEHPNSNLTLESFLDCIQYYTLLSKKPSLEELKNDVQEKNARVTALKKETKHGKTLPNQKKELEEARKLASEANSVYEKAKSKLASITPESIKLFEKYFNKNDEFTSLIQFFSKTSTTYNGFYKNNEFKEHLLHNYNFVNLSDTLYNFKDSFIYLLSFELSQQSNNPNPPYFGIYPDGDDSFIFFACIDKLNVPLTFHFPKKFILQLPSFDIPFYKSNPIGLGTTHIVYPTAKLHNSNQKKYNMQKRFLKTMLSMYTNRNKPIPNKYKFNAISLCLTTGDKDNLLSSIIPPPDCTLSDIINDKSLS